jgi:hypothetical protein
VRTSSLALLLLSSLAFAHGEGHGAKVEGTGPRGGKLSAVVLAQEAELGDRAVTRALAEWKIERGAIEVSLWGVDRKRAIAIPEGAPLKWIVVGKRLAKPIVLQAAAPAAGQPLRQTVDAAELAKADLLEIILPSLDASADKHVAAHRP